VAAPSIETLETILNVTYTWGYQDSRDKLRDLYVKATRSQWQSDVVLPWHLSPDLEASMGPEELMPLFGSPIWNRLSQRERTAINLETTSWTLSQFLHGEQGALLAAAQLVDSVQDLDSKLYGATQVVDEARHVDVYNRYLHEKIGFAYPINPHLKTLLDMILKDSRWDMKFLGMQIMVEGLALAAFGMIRMNTPDPLLRDLTAYVMGDEARHVAYGVLSLRDYYKDQPEAVRREREDFVYEAARLMRDRFLFQEVWEKTGLPVAAVHGHRAAQPGPGDVPPAPVREDRPGDQEDGPAVGSPAHALRRAGHPALRAPRTDPFAELEREEQAAARRAAATPQA
jgi:hypothetical protein